jgi:uncharacterized membrane protein YfcA
MTPGATLLVILVILFLATVIRTALGFGEALVAVPLLALVIPIDVAAPLAVLVSITVAIVIIAQDWRKVHLGAASWLVVFTLLGIPFGLWLLSNADANAIKAILALVLVAFSTYCLVSRAPMELKDDRCAWLFGWLAGVFGGAYGMNGPPLVVYGSLRRWTPEQFRATLQGYFVPASAAGMLGYWIAGKWTLAVTEYYVVSLPVVALAIALGAWIQRRLKSHHFVTVVHVGLIVIGAALLAQAALGRSP